LNSNSVVERKQLNRKGYDRQARGLCSTGAWCMMIRMPKESAGLLLYRKHKGELEFLLVHPGGPFWRNKDAGAWSIPKGEIEAGEDHRAAAQREFGEELGFTPHGEFIPLAPVKQKGGKVIHAWAVAGDCDTSTIKSNIFTVEWPPRSGRMQEFPEIDQAEFFNLEKAKAKINSAQAKLLEELSTKLPPG
jgi:predicted NUDIX family NTP pyrophosphohydrolase